MVEIEVTKEYSEHKKARQLISQIRRLKVGKYKTTCKIDKYYPGNIKITLESFAKNLSFIFLNEGKGYELTVSKITKESILLSKAIEKITYKKVKVILI